MSSIETSLYQILLKAIKSRDFDDKDIKELVDFVREQYIQESGKKGHPVPKSSYDGIDHEISDSLKAITYGFYSIKDFNDQN